MQVGNYESLVLHDLFVALKWPMPYRLLELCNLRMLLTAKYIQAMQLILMKITVKQLLLIYIYILVTNYC